MAVPGAPNGLTFGTITATSVYTYISDGATGGKTITARQIAYSKTYGSVSDFIANLSGNGMTIGNLSSSTTWSFRARAFNADGWGPWSSTFTAKTLAATSTGSTPSAPTTQTGAVSTSSVYVSVVDGYNGGSAVTGRQIGYSTTFGGLTHTVNVPGSAMTIGNLTAGTKWSFRSRVQNQYGWGAWGSPVTATTTSPPPPPDTSTPPGAPLGVVTGTATTNSLAVSYQPGSNGGSPITARQIGYSTTFGGLDYFANISSNSAVIGNLASGTQWSFRAREANKNGWGPWGSVGTGVTLGGTTPTSVPENPTLNLGSPNPASVPVTIQDGPNGGSEITMRQIGYSTTFGALTFVTDVVGSYKLIDNLSPDTTWSFRARTGNANGWGAWSKTYTAKTLPGTVPGAVLQIATGNPTSKSIDVSFADPPDGGSAITARQVAYSETYGKIEFVADVKSNITTIKNLSSNKEWSFRARVANRFGWGGWGSVTTGKTLTSVPDAPTIVTLSKVTRDSVYATFGGVGMSGTGGMPILGYELGYGLTTNPDASTKVASNGYTTVTGLSAGLKYYFWARAKNSLGWGPWSPIASVTIKSGVFVQVNGVPREAIPYVNVNGVWRKAIPQIRMSGFWRSM